MSIAEVTLDPTTYPLVAYVHYRPAGGIILSIITRAPDVPDADRREFLLTLDRSGWKGVSIDDRAGQPFPGHLLASLLPVYGYYRHRAALAFAGAHGGWARTGSVPALGRPIPVPESSPVWELPVTSVPDGSPAAFCTCHDTPPAHSYCRYCPDGRRESAYLYAVQAPPGPVGISSLTDRP